MTERFPELEFLQNLEPGTVLDGEVVVLKDGKPDFGLLLSRLGTRSELKTRVFSRSTRATYVVFDQPYERYAPLLEKPLSERIGSEHWVARARGSARSAGCNANWTPSL